MHQTPDLLNILYPDQLALCFCISVVRDSGQELNDDQMWPSYIIKDREFRFCATNLFKRHRSSVQTVYLSHTVRSFTCLQFEDILQKKREVWQLLL